MAVGIALLVAGVVQASAVSLQVPDSGGEEHLAPASRTNWTRPWNATVLTDISEEIEFELSLQAADRPAKNKLILLVLELFFVPGCLGLDRCYMGQTCLGVVKALTFGGIGLWALLDFSAVVITCLSFSSHINALGIHAEFSPHGCTLAAFWVALGVLGLLLLSGLQNTSWRTKPAASSSRSPEDLSSIFRALDKNKDGALAKKELQRGLRQRGLAEQEVEAMISRANTDSSGKVSLEEFVKSAGQQ